MAAGLGAALFALLQPPGHQRLVADTEGRIARVALVVNSARTSTLRNTALTNSIVNALPEYSQVLILAPDRAAFAVASNPWPDRIRFADIDHSYDFTIWPQDPFLVVRDGDQTRLLVSKTFQRAEDSEIARVIANSQQWPLLMSGLSFEGGNIVSDEHSVFIGANTIRSNAIEQQLSDQQVAEQFREELGKSVIVLGPLPQPIGHIDMMLTPLGNKHLLLADPGWGARLAQQALDTRPDTVAAFEYNSMALFFGDRSIQEVLVEGDQFYRPPDLDGATSQAIEDSRAIAPLLDDLANQLVEMGFTVSRVPYLHRAMMDEGSAASDDAPGSKSARSMPGYPQITYNNVLLETIADSRQRTVYLPQYGWQLFDEAAVGVWRELGYTVKPVPGFAVSAMYGGALRCAVKVLERSG